MNTHTPTPWVVEPLQWDHGASLAIVAPNTGLIVATINPDPEIQKVDEPDEHSVIRHPQDEPNAEFIVHACNMHDDLVSLVEQAGKFEWVCNAAITKDIEALRKICLQYADWWN